MLTDREQFKFAFLKECADRGLTIEEAHLVVKQASIGSFLGGIASGGAKLLSTAGTTALAAGLVIPTAVGATTGYMLGTGGGASDEDIEEEKQREVIDAYQVAAERARQRNRLAARKKQQPRMVRSLV